MTTNGLRQDGVPLTHVTRLMSVSIYFYFFQGHGIGSHLYNSGLYDVEVHQLPAAQVAGAGPAAAEPEEEASPVQKQVQEQRWVWSLSDHGQPETDVG